MPKYSMHKEISPASKQVDIMVTPLYREQEWQATLAAADPWIPLCVETIVVAPHPDDESLGAGGLIAALASIGCPIRVVAVADGENAYSDGPSIRQVLRIEQEQALQKLGVPPQCILRFGLPDSDVAVHEDELVEALPAFVPKSIRVIAPWPQDFHPDHEACGRAAERVAKFTGNQLMFYLFWTWHRGTPGILAGLPLLSFALTREQQRMKLEAIQCHHSQLVHPSGSPILPEELLWPAKQSFEVYLRA